MANIYSLASSASALYAATIIFFEMKVAPGAGKLT